MPKGWIPYDDLTDAERQGIDSLIKPGGKLVLTDSLSNGVIVASGYRNSDYWSSLELDLFQGVPVFFKDQITNRIISMSRWACMCFVGNAFVHGGRV